MARYEIRVEVSYSGTEIYEIEADSPESALDIARRGDVPSIDEDLSCDSTNWDEATIDEMDSDECEDVG